MNSNHHTLSSSSKKKVAEPFCVENRLLLVWFHVPLTPRSMNAPFVSSWLYFYAGRRNGKKPLTLNQTTLSPKCPCLPRKRKSKKKKVDLPSPSETKQSIPCLLEQLIQDIGGQSSMHEQAFSPQHGSTSTPQPVLPLKQQQWTTPKVEDAKVELQSQLESSQNVIEYLSKSIPLLQNQLELERSSQNKIRSALDEIKIREASDKAQQNVSDAILHRELSNLARAVAAFKEKGP